MDRTPHRLRTFECKRKTWTVDSRLQEFRFLKYGEMPEYVPFESEEGQVLIQAFKALWDQPF